MCSKVIEPIQDGILIIRTIQEMVCKWQRILQSSNIMRCAVTLTDCNKNTDHLWGHTGVRDYLRSCWDHGRASSLPELLLSRPDHSAYTASEPTNTHTQKQLRIQGRRCNADNRDAHQQLSFLHVLCTDSSIQWTPFSSTLSKLNTCKYQGGLLCAAIYNLQRWCSIFLKDWFTQNTKKIFGRYPLDAINSDCWHLNSRF